IQLGIFNRGGMSLQEALRSGLDSIHSQEPTNPPPQLPPEVKPAPNGSTTQEIREAMNKEIEHTEECFQLLKLVVHETKEDTIKRIQWLNKQCAFLSAEHRKIGARIQANRSMYTDEMERLDDETRNQMRVDWEKTAAKSERKTEKAAYKSELNQALKAATNPK